MQFRTLEADEIDIRAQQIKKDGSGVSLLLYKNSRVDMDILDETCGIDGWKREHSRDNHNCIVSIWSERLSQWISKEDVGTESFTEKEKGLASGSFKRACVNFGIGRELYSSPFIWVNLDKADVSDYKGKITLKTKFTVKEIEYNDKRKICKLVLQDNKGKSRYTWNGGVVIKAKVEVVTKESVKKEHAINLKPYIDEITNHGEKMTTWAINHINKNKSKKIKLLEHASFPDLKSTIELMNKNLKGKGDK